MFATLGSGLIGVTIHSAMDPSSAQWWIWTVVLGALALTFVLLSVLSRQGLRAEWRDAPEPRER